MRLSTRLLTFIALLLAITLPIFTGCGGSGSSTTPATASTAFSVAAASPANGATGVSATATIQITFSGAVDSSTVNATNIKLTGPDSQAISGTVTYNATTYAATFAPLDALAASTTYTLSVSGVTSSSGATMAKAFTSTFTTAAAQATVQYQDTVLSATGYTGGGQISIDTSGNVSVQLTGASASTTLTMQFCPAYNIGQSQVAYSCFVVDTLTTNASGDASATVQFPQAGSWAGDFQFLSGGASGTLEYQTLIVSPSDSGGSTEVYTAALQPESTVNGKGDGATGTQSPLTSGAVTYSSGSIQFTLTGAAPNTSYTSAESAELGGSESYQLENSQKQYAFTTNASGDVTFSVLQDGVPGDLFVAEPPKGAGYIGGFKVP